VKDHESYSAPHPPALDKNLDTWGLLRLRFKDWRRRVKAGMPYVRRREYRILKCRFDEAMSAISSELPPATTAQIRLLHSKPTSSKELCLFVTHAPNEHLKSHVLHHMQHLQTAGIDVVLIVNTDQPLDTFKLPDGIAHCNAVLVRENRGFDFAAWAQAALHLGLPKQLHRLYLVNDSIFGPITPDSFFQLIDKIRVSTADVVGLTEAMSPQRHLQSYFLVFQNQAIETPFLDQWLKSIRILPSKSLVISAYETRLTLALETRGFRCEAIFPTNTAAKLCSNDTSYRWQNLLARGFPYIKVSVLTQERAGATVQRLVPSPLLRIWDREQSTRLVP